MELSCNVTMSPVAFIQFNFSVDHIETRLTLHQAGIQSRLATARCCQVSAAASWCLRTYAILDLFFSSFFFVLESQASWDAASQSRMEVTQGSPKAVMLIVLSWLKSNPKQLQFIFGPIGWWHRKKQHFWNICYFSIKNWYQHLQTLFGDFISARLQLDQ